MKNRFALLLAAGLAALSGTAAFAAADLAQHDASTTAAASVMTAGEVRKIDAEQGKITLKHEAITNLDMPGMTMVFRAADPALLKNLNVGDKVRFHAESRDGAIVVTQIQAGS